MSKKRIRRQEPKPAAEPACTVAKAYARCKREVLRAGQTGLAKHLRNAVEAQDQLDYSLNLLLCR
jgi:hypothetical protein